MEALKTIANRDLPFSSLRVTTLALDYAKGFMLPLLIYQQSGGSTLAVGFAYFVEFLPRALLSPAFGSIVDRCAGYRLAFCVEGARLALMLVWSLLGNTHFGWLLSSIVSLLSGMSLVYYEATAAQRLCPAALQRFQMRSQFLEPFARIAGPGIAALAFAHLSPESSIGLLTFGYGLLLAISIASRSATSRLVASVTDRWTLNSEWRSFASLATNNKLLTLTFAAGLLNVFFGVFQSLIAPTMIGLYGLPIAYSAMPSLVGGALALALFFLIPRVCKNLWPVKLGTFGTAFLAAAGVISAVNLGPWSFCLAFGLLIVGSALFGVFFRHMRYELIPECQLAQGIGATTSVTTAFLPIAGLVTASTTAYPTVLVIGSVGFVVAGAIYASIRFVGTAQATVESLPSKDP